jgi:hypothetical protein
VPRLLAVGFDRAIEGPRADELGPVRGTAHGEEEQRVARSSLVATGTLACPECDAPVAPAPVPVSVTGPLACPFCLHDARVRDFLSLADPTRPARVEVRVRPRPFPVTA